MKTPSLQVFLTGLMLLLPVLTTMAQEQPDSLKQHQSTSVQEDVNEFLGYEDLLLVRYLSLPYDTVMNTNMAAYFVDAGFLIILFLPLIYFLGKGLPWYINLGVLALGLMILLLSVPSAFINRNKASVQEAGALLATQSEAYRAESEPLVQWAYRLKQPFVHAYETLHPLLSKVSGPRDRVTYPVLMILLWLSAVFLEYRIRDHPVAGRAVMYFTLVFAFLWLLLSSGIPWYGLLLFPMLLLFAVRGMSTAQASGGRRRHFAPWLLLVAAGAWALMAFSYRFANYDPADADRARLPFMRAVAQYQIGQQDRDFVFDWLFPQYRRALEHINQDRNSYVYRVGTLMPYFIPKNDRRVFSDNFLDFFQRLEAEFADPRELALALRAYGFRYIVLDLNLPVNDNTRAGTLRRKFDRFINFIYQNPQLQLLATDRVTRGPDGVPQLQVFPEGNTVEHAGRFAVYYIK